MAREHHVRSGWALVVLALLLLVIVAILDLSRPRSTLASLWNRSFRSETRGERLRDDLLEQIEPRR